MDRKRAAFLVTHLLFVGGNLAQAQALLSSYFFTDQLPTSSLYKITFSFVWIPVAALAGWCGIRGGYLALRSGSLRFDSLTIFALCLCPMIRINHSDLGWSIFSLNFFLGLDGFSVGTNFLGVWYLVWLSRLRQEEKRTHRVAAASPVPQASPERAPPN